MGPIDGSSLNSICLTQNNHCEFPSRLGVLKRHIYPWFNYISLYSLKGVSKTFKKYSEDLIEERSSKKEIMDPGTKNQHLSDYPNKIIWFNEVNCSIVDYLIKKIVKGENLAVGPAVTFAKTLVKPIESGHKEPQLPFLHSYILVLIEAVRLKNVDLVHIICGHHEAIHPLALYEACQLGEVEIVKVLLDKGVALKKISGDKDENWKIDPDVIDKALEISEKNGHESVVKYLDNRFSREGQFPNRCTIL